MTEVQIKRTELAFEQSLAAPIHIQNAEDAHSYDAYTFNAHIEARPLIVYLGLGTTAMTSMGQAYLREYAAAIDQPLLTLQPHANRWASLPERAASDIEALNTLNINEFDVAGASAGALIGATIAQRAGDRVSHLTTISSVGTRQGYIPNLVKLPHQMRDGVREAAALRNTPNEQPVFRATSSNFFNPRQYSEIAKLIHWSTKASLADTIEGIHDTTTWTDIIGTSDSMSEYQDHLSIVRKRNAANPHSSSLHLLGHESHMWSTKRALLAQLVKASLRD